jgi:hypothetical protein
MGLVVCPKHGNGFMFVCPHVAEAVLSDGPCGGIQKLGHWIEDLREAPIHCWFCPQCISDYQIPPSGAVTEDWAYGVPSDLHRPMCPGCFSEWLTRHQ